MTTATDITWQQGDGLLESVDYARKIVFKNGFVRVLAANNTPVNEGYGKDEAKTFDVPPKHRCEVLGAAQYYFVNC